MKDKEADAHLMQYLSGESAREAFKQQVLRDSTDEFIRVRQRRSAWRRAKLAAVVTLAAGLAFLGGRLSVPPTLPTSKDVTAKADVEPDGVHVSNELVAWLQAARLFRQLGMEDRMARAVQRAGRLLPVDTFITGSQAGQVFAATKSNENQEDSVELMGMLGPHPSAESINQILAQSFGD